MDKVLNYFFCGLFALIVVLQLHNVFAYPYTKGFDSTAHLEYITYLQKNRALPLPHEGWELHQPPLYYVLLSSFPQWLDIRLLGFGMWLVLVAAVSFFLKREQPRHKSKDAYHDVITFWFVLLTTISLPVVLYLTPAVGNEFFATVWSSVALVFYIQVFLPKSKKFRHVFSLETQKLVLGLLLGIVLLSKATGLVLVASMIIERCTALRGNIKNILLQLTVPLLLAGVLGGWFYARNTFVYGNPTYQPADYLPLESYAQPVVARDIAFLFSPEAFFTLNFFKAHTTSLPAGTYFSWFYDGHGVMLPPQEFTKAGLLVVLLSVPIFVLLAIGGYWYFAQRISQKVFLRNRYVVIYIYSLILCAAYIFYNFKLPFYSTVKASFLSSLLLPFCFFLYQGVLFVYGIYFKKFSKYSSVALTIFLLLQVFVVVRHFWVQGWWY